MEDDFHEDYYYDQSTAAPYAASAPVEGAGTLYRYIVVRKEGIRVGRQLSGLNSSMFPVLVQSWQKLSPLDAVQEAFRQRGWNEYKPRDKHYIVFTIEDADTVSFVPRKDYDIHINKY